jgi:hypothetical protein
MAVRSFITFGPDGFQQGPFATEAGVAGAIRGHVVTVGWTGLPVVEVDDLLRQNDFFPNDISSNAH